MTTEIDSAIRLGMDKFAALDAFVQSAETGSFVAAGRKLGLSASAVGKAVIRLEQRLDVRLFHRNTRNMTLTEEGRLFLERCRRIFEEVEAAEAELARSNRTPRGRLRVSLPLVGMLLTPVMAKFMRAWPEVQLDLDFSDPLVDVVEEGSPPRHSHRATIGQPVDEPQCRPVQTQDRRLTRLSGAMRSAGNP
jgi:transcriptional regulator, LysR family